MHKIEIEIDELKYASELIELSELNDDIDLITEKSFNGDLTTIELYISIAFNIIAIVVPIIKTLTPVYNFLEKKIQIHTL